MDLRGRGVNAIAPTLGSDLPALAKLDLGDNVLGNDCVASIATIATLKHLNLANNALEGDALRPFLEAARASAARGGDDETDAAAGKPSGKNKEAEAKKPIVRGRRGKRSEALSLGSNDRSNGADGPLPFLRVLNVSGNALRSLSGLGEAAPNLGAIVANENRIETLRDLKALTDLNTIIASSNAIDELGDAFYDLVHLKKLSLSHNALVTLSESLGRCVGLRELRLAHNAIKSLPKKSLSPLKELRILDVSGNLFEEFGDVEVLRSLPKLQHLSLRGSPLAMAGNYDSTVVKMCPGLKTLDGRRVLATGWVDGDGGLNDGGSKGKPDRERVTTGVLEGHRSRSSEGKTRDAADAWAEARSAAGLDPLEGEDGEDGASDEDGSPENDPSSESREMDEEARRILAEVQARRAKTRAEEKPGSGGKGTGERPREGTKKNADAGAKEKNESKKRTVSSRKRGGTSNASSEPGAEGTSFLQELVARNRGEVLVSSLDGLRRGAEDGFEGAGGPRKKKTEDEKSAARTRSGVVKIVEVKTQNHGGVLVRGREALNALRAEYEEADDAKWGGWGGDDEADAVEAYPSKSKKHTKEGRTFSESDAFARTSASEIKKKKNRRDSSLDSPGEVPEIPRASAETKKRAVEDDPWNDEEAKRRKKSLLKKRQNVLARRYRKETFVCLPK